MAATYCMITLSEKDCWKAVYVDKPNPFRINFYTHLMPSLDMAEQDVLLQRYYPGRLDQLVAELNPDELPKPCMKMVYDGSLAIQPACPLSVHMHLDSNKVADWQGTGLLAVLDGESAMYYYTTRNLRLAREIAPELAERMSYSEGILTLSKPIDCDLYLGQQFSFRGGEAIKNREIFREKNALPAINVDVHY